MYGLFSVHDNFGVFFSSEERALQDDNISAADNLPIEWIIWITRRSGNENDFVGLMVTKSHIAQCILVHRLVHFVRLDVFGTHRGRDTIELHFCLRCIFFFFGRLLFLSFEKLRSASSRGPGRGAFVVVECSCADGPRKLREDTRHTREIPESTTRCKNVEGEERDPVII